jgi:hypothetical protein
MVPCDQLQAANNTINPLLQIATDAYNEYPARPINVIWPFSVGRGTAIHAYFANAIWELGGIYSAEVSYKNGLVVPYGTSGSVRADAVVGPVAQPSYVVDLKSGFGRATTSETDAYRANLPKGTGMCQIVEALGQ